MALILVRGDSVSKIVNSIKSMEFQGKFNLKSKPVIINPKFADSIVEDLLKSKVKRQSKFAVAFLVSENNTLSILKIKKLRPPAHVVVVSDEFEDNYNKLMFMANNGAEFQEYTSSRFVSEGIIDYSIKKKEKQFVKNNRLNSYVK